MLVLWSGSSPRGRGKHGQALADVDAHRLIPTRAGKTRVSRIAREAAKAHPHAGGENDSAFASVVPIVGSSPRGRGKPPSSHTGPPRAGLIPTRAGKTFSERLRRSRVWAHPHAGGENKATDPITGDLEGSSPRGRGKHGERADRLADGRLIPTRAGKT